jgi:hypothetical protein
LLALTTFAVRCFLVYGFRASLVSGLLAMVIALAQKRYSHDILVRCLNGVGGLYLVVEVAHEKRTPTT